MNLLGAVAYDPAGAVSKSTASLLAMTAFDTSNLRLTVTVPAHGMLWVRMRCNLSGATTMPQVMLGVLESSTVRGRQVPLAAIPGTALATTNVPLVAEFPITGLTPGSITLDAAYAVETVVASTNIHYGGPNNTSANDAWGAFVFEIYDPRPLKLALDGGVNVTQYGGSAGTFSGGRPEVNVSHLGGSAIDQSGGLINANVKQISGDATAADNEEAFFDGTGYAGTNNVIPTVTTAVNVTTVNGLAANVITAAATASDFGTEIAAAVWDRLTSALTTVGSIGKLLVDNINATISSRSSHSAADVWAAVTRTLTSAANITSTGGTTVPQTGDSFARLGAPAGASVSADVAAVKAQTAAIETDTQDIQGRLPAALTAGGNMKSDMLALNGGTQSAADLKDFADDGYDPATNKVQGVVLTDTVTTYTGNTPQTGDVFPLASTEIADIKAKTDNLPSDPADESLIIAATDAIMARLGAPAGASVSADIAAVKSDTAAILVDTAEIGAAGAGLTALGDARIGNLDAAITTRAPAATAVSNADFTGARAAKLDNLDAAVSTRAPSATALSTAQWTNGRAGNLDNLDALISSRLASGSYTAPNNAGIAAIKLQTDKFTFTVANMVDCNIEFVNGTEVTGDGSVATPWGP